MQTTMLTVSRESSVPLTDNSLFEPESPPPETMERDLEDSDRESFEFVESEERFWGRDQMRKLLGRTRFLIT
jgi:hypothetical protein